MDSVSCMPEKSKKEQHHKKSSSRKLIQALTVVRLTCEGNLHEPDFEHKLRRILKKIKFLVSNGKKSLDIILINLKMFNILV